MYLIIKCAVDTLIDQKRGEGRTKGEGEGRTPLALFGISKL